jgi:hypothetical protein
MGVEKISERYVVYIRPGESMMEAVAQHRERTGYGGMCFLVFLKPSLSANK